MSSGDSAVLLISVNVGLPRNTIYRNRSISTGIFKVPVAGRVRVRKLNLDGDKQADLTVHGGEAKAVYAYPLEHYDYWGTRLPDVELPYGAFGENFTISGLSEQSTRIGDQYRIGSAILTVTQPRMPCYKLAARFARDDMIERFLRSGRTGFYLAVLQEGEVGAGDAVELLHRDENNLSVASILQLHLTEKADVTLLRRVVAMPALSAGWREHFQQRLNQLVNGSAQK